MVSTQWIHKHRFVFFVLAFALYGTRAIEGAGLHRIHINVGDPQSAAQWYATKLGGRANTRGSAPTVVFGRTTIVFSKADGTIPGSVGSGIDHLGFSFDDLDGAMKRLAESGVTIISGIEKEGPVRYAFIKDPWSTLIEVVEDREIRGFHHIHLAATDPAATLKWYADLCGGKVTRFAGLIAGIRYGEVWVLVKKVKRRPAPTKGRAIDHVAWSVDSRDAALKKLRGKGAELDLGPTKDPASRPLFVNGPDGVRMEIIGPAAE